MMPLFKYGWNEHFARAWQNYKAQPGEEPGRVIADYGLQQRIATATGEVFAANSPGLVVGDWVVLARRPDSDLAAVHAVLPRKTKFSRAAAGQETKEQVVAANVDIVFLVQSLNRDYNLRRLERYLVAAWQSGAVPVIVLTKSDCCDDVADKLERVYRTAPGVEAHAVSAVTGEGMDALRAYFKPGITVALLGSSGVGKSTLVNTLAGREIMKTREIRESDGRGRHTTSLRSILLLPGGGLILDTPGMRELALWEADRGMEAVFGDIEQLAVSCRFGDCRHGNEPGCAVREALRNGSLTQERWASWQKLQRELAYLETKKDSAARMQRKRCDKQLAKLIKQYKKG